MLTYVRNKLLNNKWMAISLLIGNILLMAIAGSSPIYREAVMQRLLQTNLQRQMQAENLYPGTIEFHGTYTTVGLGQNDYSLTEKLKDVAERFAAEPEIAPIHMVTEYFMADQKAQHEGEAIGSAMAGFSIRIDSIEDMENHVTMLNGTFPSETAEDHVIETIVSENTLMRCNLYVGETLTLPNLKASDGDYWKLKIVGVFQASETNDPYWYMNPNVTSRFFFINEKLFASTFVFNETERKSFSEAFYVTMDYTKLRGTDVDALVEVCDRYIAETDTVFRRGMNVRFYDTLKAFQSSSARLDTTLTVLQIPIFLLLIAFIFMVAGEMMTIDQSEISMIKSRGASRRQILTIYLLQSTILAVIGLIFAIPLSFLICQVIGSANAFLEFVQRRALSTRFSLEVVLYLLAAVIVAIAAMLIPAISYSKVGIVEAKRSRHKQKRPLWQKLFLDVLFLGISLYGLYSYHRQAAFLASEIAGGASLDPLLYLCSSLFILGAAMLFVRLFPLLIRLVFELFKHLWSPGLYASFLRMLRSNGSQNFIMIFLILTMAMGIFSADTARTINSNAEEMIRYRNGADIVVREKWGSQQFATESGDTETVYVEPDYTKYEKLSGAASATKVFMRGGYRVTSGGTTQDNVTVMGIHTKSFGETAYFKDGLLNGHWYNYLNAMSQDSLGVLVSTNFRDKLGLTLGDKITYSMRGRANVTGVIYGFVDYWPSLTPPDKTEGDTEMYFVIANLSYLQSKWGVEPYSVWIRNSGNSSQYIYDFAAESETGFTYFADTNAQIIDLKNDPIFQATNGILTVGFIVVLTLCSVGFLIYWILSIRSRQLQFGIFRAMGMTMGEILGMLGNEQIFLSLSSIIAGALVGKLAARFYVPLIQLAYSADSQLIPLEVVSRRSDAMQLYLVVGIVMIICMFVLGQLIRKIKIAQALKLGED